MSQVTLTRAPANPAPKVPVRKRFYKDLSLQVLVAMALGVGLAVWRPHIASEMKPLGDAFIRLIQMIVGPIIFCTVVQGIGGMRDLGRVGRIAFKAILYFELVTSLALVIGLLGANLLQPGVGLHVDPSVFAGANSQIQGFQAQGQQVGGIADFLLNIIPNAALGGFARGDVLQILFFSVLFACGLAASGDAAKPVLDVVAGATKALFWIINKVMRLAPIGAFGAISFSVAKFGLASLGSLGALIGEFYLTCLVFIVAVLLPISLWAGFSLWKLMRYIREELLLVLGTSSSESVFPQLSAKLTRLGADESVVGLVLPTAYSFNHDGACLYFAAVTVFLAQVTHTAIGWQQQLGLLGVLLLTSKGGAGVSGSALAVLAMTLTATKTIPVGSMALILGIHRLLSAGFVFVNIAGNAVATLVVARWEGALDRTKLTYELNAGYRA
jgi:aerobic C4-dicarboxylate transport protein